MQHLSRRLLTTMIALFNCCVWPVTSLAEDQVAATVAATTRQPTPLLQQPLPEATILAQLGQAQPLQVLTRQGGWYQVAPAEKPQGWVRLFALQFNKTMYKPDNQPLRDIQGILIPGHNQVTSSTGVRGLDQVSIENAKGDFDALVALQALQQTPAAALAFAAEAHLQTDDTVALKDMKP